MEVRVIRSIVFIFLSCWFVLAQEPGADPVAIARRYMPPNAQLEELYTFDYSAGRVGEKVPAVLRGHILSPDSKDIVFTYYSRESHVLDKTLFIDILHQTAKGYEKVYEVSYRSQLLFVPNAMQIVHLPGVDRDAVAVMAGAGAALGGHLDIFLWREPFGWQNIFPPNGSIEYFYFFPSRTGLEIALSASRHPGKSGLPAPDPPPLWFRWDGAQFVKIPPPMEFKGKE